MTDINELAQRMKATALKAIADEGPTWFSKDQLSHPEGIALHEADVEFIALASHENVLALVEALEAKQPHHNGMMQLSNELVMAKQRIAELEAREVKLPDINCFLADDLEDATLAEAFRLLAKGVQAADVAAIRRAGIRIHGEAAQ